MNNILILATNNQGKIAEFQHLLALPNVQVKAQSDYQVGEVAETGATFIENALIKARYAAEETGLPVLADDSGLIVDALHGAPGIYSARYAGPGKSARANYEKVLNELQGIPMEQRNAHFHCSLVFLPTKDAEPIICSADWHGHILTAPQGEQGFGYDPIFYVPSHHCSAAELSETVKNEISHRGQALQKLRPHLQKWIATLRSQ